MLAFGKPDQNSAYASIDAVLSALAVRYFSQKEGGNRIFATDAGGNVPSGESRH